MNSTQIKPIETYYNGYRFRSRLEARWAVFFDAAGIKYQYEEQGFEKDGQKYLPDFYLPELDVYAEVKGNRDGALEEIERIRDFVYWGSPIKKLIILSEIPFGTDKGLWHFPCLCYDVKYDCAMVWWWYFYDGPGRVVGDIPNMRCRYQSPWLPWLLNRQNTYFDPKTCILPRGALEIQPEKEKYIPDVWDGGDYCCNKLVFAALTKARQARFEHGEKG
jgi:hypothetical protein